MENNWYISGHGKAMLVPSQMLLRDFETLHVIVIVIQRDFACHGDITFIIR